MSENPRAEAERLLGVAEKLLQSRDFNGTKDFAVLAQETEPLLDGSDQILAVAEVMISAEKRINNHHDWYSILQIERRSDDQELIKKQYRRLALLLHPDKNKFPFADQAFKLVADAWAVLSEPGKKSLYDSELNLFSKVDLTMSGKLPVKRGRGRPPKNASASPNLNPKPKPKPMPKPKPNNYGVSGVNNYHEDVQRVKPSSFWTTCPYCYVLYEYSRVYEGCCLKCQNCERAFHAAILPYMPPLVPGRDAYYCHYGFFPLGYVLGGGDGGGKGAGSVATAAATAFPNWMPPMFGSAQQGGGKSGGGASTAARPPARMGIGDDRDGAMGVSDGISPGPRKRGRPRKII